MTSSAPLPVAPAASSAPNAGCIVVVPMYRADLLAYERVALERCLEVLHRHAIAIVKPRQLDLSALQGRYGLKRLESFDDDFFKGIGGYNRLMLSDGFYARFADHAYLLVHQLDAFVFEDRLQAWCDRGYDYVGAPWLPHPWVPSRGAMLYGRVRRTVARWTDRRDARSHGVHGAQYMYAVGNGGFSLRRVASMRATIAALPQLAQSYRRSGQLFANEDMFFSVAANRFRQRVKVPDFREAAGFAWELQPAVARALNGGQLPFGCHAWNKLHRDDWRPIFASFGHRLDALVA